MKINELSDSIRGSIIECIRSCVRIYLNVVSVRERNRSSGLDGAFLSYVNDLRMFQHHIMIISLIYKDNTSEHGLNFGDLYFLLKDKEEGWLREHLDICCNIVKHDYFSSGMSVERIGSGFFQLARIVQSDIAGTWCCFMDYTTTTYILFLVLFFTIH